MNYNDQEDRIRALVSKLEKPVVVVDAGIEERIFPKGLPVQATGRRRGHNSIGLLKRQYNAAIVDRLSADFTGSNLSFNSELRSGLKMMRGRSRNLARNDDYTKAFLAMVVKNIVGPVGFKLQMMVKNPDGTLDEQANAKIYASFIKWGENKKTCSVTKRTTWAGAQRLIARMWARDGEVFIRKVKGFDNPYSFAIQIIPADYVDETYDANNLPNGNRVIMGVELNQWGERVAYHVLQYHPGDLNPFPTIQGARRLRIPASEISHLFIEEDSDQVRGVPWVYAAMNKLNQLNAYAEAEVIAARLQACKMGFLEPDEEAEIQGDVADDDGNILLDAAPGMFEQLPAGWKFKEWNPTHPNGNFAAFSKGILRGVSASLGVSYNTLCQDLEGVNFSSIRAGTIDERDGWKVLQQIFIEDVCEDGFEDWLSVALLLPELKPLPFTKFDKFNAPYFQGRRWEWVDPEKDMRAAAFAVLMGWKTNEEVCNAIGGNFYENIKKLEEEKKKMEESGVIQQIPQSLSTVGEEEEPPQPPTAPPAGK